METVKKSMEQKKSRFTWRGVKRNEVIHTFGKILYVPAAARNRLIEWRMYQMNMLSYIWLRLRKNCEEYTKTCHECQITKQYNKKKKYNLIPEKEDEITKWSRVNINCYRPRYIKNRNGYDYNLHVINMVDPVTGWFVTCQLSGPPTAYRCQQIFDTIWLSRYLRPKETGNNNGSEFKGVFEELCKIWD